MPVQALKKTANSKIHCFSDILPSGKLSKWFKPDLLYRRILRHEDIYGKGLPQFRRVRHQTGLERQPAGWTEQ